MSLFPTYQERFPLAKSMQSYTMSMFVGSIKYLDKSLLETSPLGEITSPLQKDQVPTSEIKDALKAYHKLVSPLKP
jgi:hypothetical protein